jgi:hypothetical protein
MSLNRNKEIDPGTLIFDRPVPTPHQATRIVFLTGNQCNGRTMLEHGCSFWNTVDVVNGKNQDT